MKEEELVKKVLEISGFKELNPVQKEALKKGLLKGKNLVIFAPTASGKTLCAELAAIKTILEKKEKVVYMVPLVALANEKYQDFRKKYSQLGVKVALSIGDLDSADPFLRGYDLIVVSNEKMDSLIRHGAEWISDIGLIVADEIHLLDQADRGPTLEITLTLLRKLVPDSQVLALCLDGNTLVYPENSNPIKIADLVENEFHNAKRIEKLSYKGKEAIFIVPNRRIRILSLDKKIVPKFKEVIGLWKVKCSKFYQIKLQSGREIAVTEETPVLGLDGGIIKWIFPQKIRKGMYLPFLRKLPSKSCKVHTISLIKRGFVEIDYGILCWLRDARRKFGTKELAKILNVSVSTVRVLSGGFAKNLCIPRLLSLAKSLNVLPKVIQKVSIVKSRNGKKCSIPRYITPDLMYYAGLVGGDGNIDRRRRVRIQQKKENKSVIKVFCDLTWKLFKLRAKKRKKNETIDAWVNSGVIADILENMGIPSGTKSSTVYPMNFLYSMPKQHLKAYIRGWFDAESYVSSKDRTIGFSIESESVAKNLAQVLLNLGILCYLGRDGKKYRIYITGRESLFRFGKIGFRNSRLNKLLKSKLAKSGGGASRVGIPSMIVPLKELRKKLNLTQKELGKKVGLSRRGIQHYENGNHTIPFEIFQKLLMVRGVKKILRNYPYLNDNIVWLKVRGIKTINSDGWKYDLCIKGTHKFIANNLIVHNSATIKNAKELAKWLNAETVISEWRPVKLYKGVAYPYQVKFLEKEGCELDSALPLEESIVKNTLTLRKQALIFVSTRRSAESLAEKLGKVIKPHLSKLEERELVRLSNEVETVLETPTKQCKRIAKCIRFGSAFHHAGLLYKQKSFIEENFRKGLIKAIVATPTLCLHPNTFVITKNGAKKVCEVNKGDLVLTHNSNFKKVISPCEREFRGELLSIKPFGSLEVKMTPEHRILVIKQIRHKSHYSDGTQKIWWEYSEPEWLKASELYEAFTNNEDEKVSFMLLQPIPSLDITCDRICLKSENSYVRNQYGKTNTIHPASDRTPEYLLLNYEVSRLIGAWIAEGSTSRTGSVIFDIATYEESLTKFITTTIKKYFPKAKIVIKDKERNRRRIRFCNKNFAKWLRENIGNNAHSKKIPTILLLNRSRDVRLGLFHGLLEGDGYIRVDNKTRSHYASYNTVSPSLSYQLQILLASLGYLSSISKGEKSPDSFGGEGIFYNVKVGGKSFYNLLKELKINLNQKEGNRVYNINKILNNYLLLKIKEIRKEKYLGKVYNLGIEGDESYSVGFIVHNSYGVNLPSFRVVMRDLKRYYPGIGAVFVPILDVQQMLGRAGRPAYDSFGEGIILAKSEEEAEEIIDHYFYGELEEITSKLAVEPVLRMHTLALIASEFCKSEKTLLDFFSKTFYAFQYDEISTIKEKILDILEALIKWKFVEKKKDKLIATRIGRRVSELYIDPLTAHHFIKCLTQAKNVEIQPFSFLHTISNTIEMRPLLSVRIGEFSELAEEIVEKEDQFLEKIPNEWDLEYDDFLKSVKTALMFEAWITEATEDYILNKFKVAPGEFYGRREIADWLIYSLQELALLLGYKDLLKHIRKLRVRVEYGVKEELIPLVRLKQIGRIRARKLYSSNLKTLADLRKISIENLSQIVGPKIAYLIKEQLGQVPKTKGERQSKLSE